MQTRHLIRIGLAGAALWNVAVYAWAQPPERAERLPPVRTFPVDAPAVPLAAQPIPGEVTVASSEEESTPGETTVSSPPRTDLFIERFFQRQERLKSSPDAAEEPAEPIRGERSLKVANKPERPAESSRRTEAAKQEPNAEPEEKSTIRLRKLRKKLVEPPSEEQELREPRVPPLVTFRSPKLPHDRRQRAEPRKQTRTPENQNEPIRVAIKPGSEESSNIAVHAEGSAASPPSQPAVCDPFDALQLETRGPKRIRVGSPAPYTFVLTNTTGKRLDGVYLEISLPQHTSVVQAVPAFEIGKHVWNVGSLEPYSSVSLTAKVVRQKPGPFEVHTWLAMAQHAMAQIDVLEPELRVEIFGVGNLKAGKSLPLVLSVHNTGKGVVRDVQLDVELPEFLRTSVGQQARLQVGTLESGQRKDVDLPVSVLSNGKGDVQVCLRAEGGMEIHSVEPLRVHESRLSLTAQGPTVQKLNDIALCTAELINDSDVPLGPIMVVSSLDDSLEVVDAEHGAKIDTGKRLLSWNVPKLHPGEKQMLRWWVVARQAGVSHQSVIAGIGDQIREAGTITTQVESGTSLVLEMRDLSDPVTVGDEIIYRGRIYNAGKHAAQRLVIEGRLEEGLSPIQVNDPLMGDWRENRIVFKRIERLDPGKSTVFQIRAIAGQGGKRQLKLFVTNEQGQTLVEQTEVTLVRDAN